jgi:dihydrofolate reductase
MTLTLIACVDENAVLSCNGSLAYEIPADLRHFAQTTRDKTVFVGKNTYAECSELPGRNWVLLTRETFDQQLRAAALSHQECFLGGGAPVYKAGLAYCQTLLLSVPHRTKTFSSGDTLTHFPQGYRLLFKLLKTERRQGFDLQHYSRI